MAKKGELVVVEEETKYWSQADYEVGKYYKYAVAKVGSATRTGITKTVQFPILTEFGRWHKPVKVDRSCEKIYTLPPMNEKALMQALVTRKGYWFDTKEEIKDFLRPFVRR